MNRTCYIVDDERHAIKLLSDYIAQTPELELVGYSDNPIVAFEQLSAGSPPDIAFLDVDMPQLSGLQLAGLVNGYTTVIITTAFREYAMEAFEKQAFDYLLKPISYERFLQSINKVKKHGPERSASGGMPEPFLFVKTGLKNRFTRVAIADIKYISGSLNYIELFLKERKVLTYMSLTGILEKLPPLEFSRIHKSFIVNHLFIQTLEYGQVTMSDHSIIPIGRVHRKSFHHKMKTSFSKGPYDH